jgi:hypothetical protein
MNGIKKHKKPEYLIRYSKLTKHDDENTVDRIIEMKINTIISNSMLRHKLTSQLIVQSSFLTNIHQH